MEKTKVQFVVRLGFGDGWCDWTSRKTLNAARKARDKLMRDGPPCERFEIVKRTTTTEAIPAEDRTQVVSGGEGE